MAPYPLLIDSPSTIRVLWIRAALLAWLCCCCECGLLSAQSTAAASNRTNGVTILAIEGETKGAEVARAGANTWDPAYVGQPLFPGDRGRSGPDTRLTLRLSDLSILRIAERSEFTIKAPPTADQTYGMTLWKGLIYLFHRDKPGSTRIDSRTATAATRGTEFIVQVDESTQKTTLSVLAGAGELTNELGSVTVAAGERGEAAPGGRPLLTPRLETRNLIQWVLYYPGVLNVQELQLRPEQAESLAPSLAAYRSGDLAGALRAYREPAQPASQGIQIYRAALELGVGQVAAAEPLLSAIAATADSPLPGTGRAATHPALAKALRRMIEVVKDPVQARNLTVEPGQLATEWIVLSYQRQAAGDLTGARAAATECVTKDAEFGFGWTRLAELEFGFGRIKEARRALANARRISPRNAQSMALSGFLAVAEFDTREARRTFDEAIALDGGLASAWLGRGLLRIRTGDLAGGREDLQIAAALEPQRGILRSYLAKAWTEARDLPHAREELALAQSLDPQDPTGWLYSALLNQNHNRQNEAIRDLQHAQFLNENRAVYRSKLLLDRDRAVRGANLAGLYAEIGLTEVGLSEAARAISSDYSDYSAHLFLANTYNRLRDPHQVNTRWETPWLSEYLVANLLAPAGAGIVSQAVSDQEYSRFFERDGFGLVSQTDYLSRGDWLQTAAHYGRFAQMSYALETSYRSERGQRPNEDLTSHFVDVQFKQDFTPQDSLFFQGIYFDSEAGDLIPHYQPLGFPKLRVKEVQEPILLAGYRHEWAPGIQTLFLGGRISDVQRLRNPASPALLFIPDSGILNAFPTTRIDQRYDGRAEIYTAELQQIVQREHHTWVFGGRTQLGAFHSDNTAIGNNVLDPIPGFQVEEFSRSEADFERFTGYLYDHWQWTPSFLTVAGLSYDHVRYPRNHRFAPLASGEESLGQVSPKLGLVWTPRPDTTVRAAYSRSLSGVAFDQSFQLEPSQIAGFNQVFRSLIPESVASANSAAEFQLGALAVERRFGSNTWAQLSGEWLNSEVDRTAGGFLLSLPSNLLPAFSFRERLRYEERSLAASLQQLLGNEWSLGARYRVSYATLDTERPDFPSATFPATRFDPASTSALLHQARLFVHFQHPSGFFSTVEALWHNQDNFHYSTDLKGNEFWQFNLYAGFRWPNRRAEVRLGLLNVTDQDYRLNPLNLTADLPRERTLALTLKLNF